MSVDWTVCRDRAGHLLSATEIGTNLGDGCGYLDLDTTCELLP